jgi:hypothetical protein
MPLEAGKVIGFTVWHEFVTKHNNAPRLSTKMRRQRRNNGFVGVYPTEAVQV